MAKANKLFQTGLITFILLLPIGAAVAAIGTSGGGFNGSSGGATNGSSGGSLNGSSNSSVDNPLGGNGPSTLCGLIKKILDVVVAVGLPFAVFFIVYAGFLFVWARGNPVALEHAKRNLVYTVLGLSIFFGAWLLVQVVANTLNLVGSPDIQACK